MTDSNCPDNKTLSDLSLLCSRCCEHLIAQLEEHIAEKGKINGYQVHFNNIIQKWHMKSCGLRIVQSFKGDDLRALEIYATFPDNSGYEIKNYLIHGSNVELKNFLSDKSLAEKMIEIYANFSEKIADKI